MSDPVYTLGDSPLTVADVVRASRGPLRLGLTAGARARMAAARAVVEDHLASDRPVYGLNTGLGANLGYRFARDAIPGFQEQLIRGRVIGVGDLLPPGTGRAALFCRAAALAKGGAGISPDVHELMMAMLERDVTPAIPSRGSIGAGDLGLLASMASVVTGGGQAFHAGRLLPGGDALAAAGLRPVALGAKDGLALVNASALTTAMASLALDAARKVLQVHVATAAFACDGYAANPRIFDARLAAARPARGQESAAALYRRARQGSSLPAGSEGRVQDALCFRTLAQVTGTALAACADTRDAVETELNSAADNPLVLIEAGEIHSTANFHTPAIALAFDALAIAMTYVATASAYRSIKLMTGRLTGLPDYLAPAGGASAGFVPLQKTISALQAEIRLKAYPASLDAIGVSDAVEDLAPQTPLTIRKFEEQLDLLRWLISIEALTAAQAWDLRRARDGRTQPGQAGRELHPIVRSAAPFMDQDRETGPDVTAVHEALWSEPAITALDAIVKEWPPLSERGGGEGPLAVVPRPRMAKALLTPRAVDFPRWYQDVIAKAELAENGPARGSMVIRPTGYALWERIQRELDDRIKAAGAANAYFPLLIPESYLRREAEHVEGFSPELAVVTIGGGKQLEEPLVIRPTSETVIGESMARWVESYRDLPLLLNQWSNVVRWELRPRLFLRTTEFLWQEGHTAHVSEADARDYARRILHDVYEDVLVNVLSLPVVVGRKTVRERFAGATSTYTLEAMMGDGKALQMGTSHELGQNFARAFCIDYLAASGQRELAWTTSWGITTRLIGGVVMAHGDDFGLRVPPRAAAVQVAVLMVKEGAGVAEVARNLTAALRGAGVRAMLDERVDVPFGRRAIDAELKGYPVRIEVGPRDIAENRVMMVRRVTGERIPVPVDGVASLVASALEADQKTLYDEALAEQKRRTAEVTSVPEAVEAAGTGWARLPWSAVGGQGEAELNAQGITVRCLVRADGGLPGSEDEPDLVAVVGRAY